MKYLFNVTLRDVTKSQFIGVSTYIIYDAIDIETAVAKLTVMVVRDSGIRIDNLLMQINCIYTEPETK